MRRRSEFEKGDKPPSPAPRFSRTFDLLLSRFPDSADLSTNSSSIMAWNRNSFQSSTSDEKSGYKPGQWRASVSAPLCAFCNKTVYPAEEVIGAGQRFHKLCLKCTSCNTLLNTGNLNERDKKIYCGTCYSRQFGPRGGEHFLSSENDEALFLVGRGLATSYVSNLETPPTSPNSNQEETDSNNELTSTDDSGFDQKISINSSNDDSRRSTSMIFPSGVTTRQTISTVNRPTSASVTSGSAFKMMSISGNICPRCSKTVYSAEEVKAAGKSFHKRCYTCANCKGSISGGRYSERNGELYDNNCYQRLFGPKGVGFGVGSGTLSTGN